MAELKTYKGNDGNDYTMPFQTCPHCGSQYQSFFNLKMGCEECRAKARDNGWMSAADIAAKMRAEMLADGKDPDACDCGECWECEERNG